MDVADVGALAASVVTVDVADVYDDASCDVYAAFFAAIRLLLYYLYRQHKKHFL